jgi:hypothetical protein
MRRQRGVGCPFVAHSFSFSSRLSTRGSRLDRKKASREIIFFPLKLLLINLENFSSFSRVFNEKTDQITGRVSGYRADVALKTNGTSLSIQLRLRRGEKEQQQKDISI